jgi:hypothetical protein
LQSGLRSDYCTGHNPRIEFHTRGEALDETMVNTGIHSYRHFVRGRVQKESCAASSTATSRAASTDGLAVS